MNKRIYLVRHGKIDCGNVKRYIGNTDLELSSEGIEQAKKAKEYFSGIEIEKVYVSTLKRCTQTAEIILESRNIDKILLNELKEINMGEWEGQSFEYIKACYPEQFEIRGKHIDTFVPPGGESFFQLQNRVMPVIEQIINSDCNNILIISHAGVNRAILSKLLGLPLNELLNICQPYGCINELFWDQACHKWQHKIIK